MKVVPPEPMEFGRPSRRKEILEEILPAIRKNCTISDASHSGHYSLCTLFLRLRDQYLWEHDLPPWAPTEQSDLLSWIDRKETLWLECVDLPFEAIPLNGRAYHPLNHRGVNLLLGPYGLYYGAGYGRGLKPTFFLASVRENRIFRGHKTILLGREHASDMMITPALHQGGGIILRLAALRLFLWWKIQEIERFEREAVAWALRYYGWDSSLPPGGQLDRIVEQEAETILHHELGEALDRTFPRRLWRLILSHFSLSRTELFLRSLKDLLADTHPAGTLGYITKKRKSGSLGFYLSNLKGISKLLFPELVAAFPQFKKDGDWSTLERLGQEKRHQLVSQARRITEMATRFLPASPDRFSRLLESEYLKPLGI